MENEIKLFKYPISFKRFLVLRGYNYEGYSCAENENFFDTIEEAKRFHDSCDFAQVIDLEEKYVIEFHRRPTAQQLLEANKDYLNAIRPTLLVRDFLKPENNSFFNETNN